MSVENITAMARLRGSQLKTFYIPRCCVSIIEEAPYDQDAIDWDTSYTQLLAEVALLSKCLTSSAKTGLFIDTCIHYIEAKKF